LKLIKLISENVDHVNKIELKLLNYLHSNLESRNPESIYKVLVNDLHIDDRDLIGRVIKLYKNNIIEDDETYDELIEWELTSEDRYSRQVRAISKLWGVVPEFFIFRGDVYDLKTYKFIENGGIYEVGTYDDLVRSIREKMFENEFSGYRTTLIEKYIVLDEESLNYNINEKIQEEIGYKSIDNLLEYLEYIDDGQTVEAIRVKRTKKEMLLEIEGELKLEEKKMNSLLKKIESLESERAVIKQELEGDDEDYNRFEKYLNKIETKLSELNIDYHNISQYISDLESDIDELNDNEISDEDIKNMYLHYRFDELEDEYKENPIDYVYESEMTISEAIDDGLIQFDEMGMIKEMIGKALNTEHLMTVDIDNQSYFVIDNFYHKF
jgi:hypothetical protein